MSEISFNELAYCKMILHAVKYPHCAINGVLLATLQDTKESPKNLTFVDAIPLFHLCLHVTPMIEVALTQISSYAQSNGLVIAGYYLANENIRDVSYDKPYQSRIADKIAEYFPSACLVVLDNKKITQTMQEPALLVAHNSDGKWKPVNKNSVSVDDTTLSSVSTLIQKNMSQYLVDFDNHLDNLSQDWTNSSLNEIIEEESQT
uniref:ER membrane protein complex subunit 8/9 homolog n=1 Tax=Cacopsylla melanoneura TaxID=428564 RepID=A0A8D8LG17_9HEMI